MNPFMDLIAEGRLDECRVLAEKTLQAIGHTNLEAAQSYHAIAHCHVAVRNAQDACVPGEMAWKLAVSVPDWDLAGQALLDLSTAYGQLSRFRKQIRTLRRYLVLLERMSAARRYEPIARYRLGWAAFHMMEDEAAEAFLSDGLLAAERWEDSQTADLCRQLMRALRIRAGRLDEVPQLLEQSAAYLGTQSQDRSAAFGYWYGMAQYTRATGRLAEAIVHALKALEHADGYVENEVECHLLLCECATGLGDESDALGFALAARVCAIEGGRYDLAYGATAVIDNLLSTATPSVLEGFSRQFAQNGLDVFRYIPPQVLNRGIAGA